MAPTTWRNEAYRLSIFNGKLLPAKIIGKKKVLLIEKFSKIKDQNFTVDDCLKNPQLNMIGLRTDLDFICIDIDGQKGSELALKKGFDWTKHRSWYVGRRDNTERFAIIYRRTPKQQKFGQIHINDNENEIDLLASPTAWKVVMGDHPSGDLYRWFGQGPEDLSFCPDHAWSFVVNHVADFKDREEQKAFGRTPTPRGTWRPARPCIICGRDRDNDCSINRDNNFVLCHHGKNNHPPTLRVGETIEREGQSWAFCGFGRNHHGLGKCSKFKLQIKTPLPWDIIYGGRND